MTMRISYILFIFLALFLLFMSASHSQIRNVSSQRVVWENPVRISNTSGSAFPMKPALSGDTIHVIYVEYGTYYIRSTDGGLHWDDQKLLIDADSAFQLFSRPLVSSGSNVYLVWGNINPSGAITSIKIRRSLDAGATWLDPQIIYLNDKPFVWLYAPMVGAVDNWVFVLACGSIGPWRLDYHMFRS